MGAAYATEADLQTYLGRDQWVLLTDRDGDGNPDDGVAAQALEQAATTIDTNLAGRYDLPLSDDQAKPLRQTAMDIAAYRLETGSPVATELRRERYEDALAFLKLIRDGKATLGAPARAPQPDTPAMSVPPASGRWPRGALGLG